MGTKNSRVYPRRKFFDTFIGEIAVLYDEAKGIKQVPLNRIQDLPQKIIRDIRPVCFNNPDWKIIGKRLLKSRNNKYEYTVYKEFTETEFFIIQRFNRSEKLYEISTELSAAMNIKADDAYTQVTAFFFQMISLLVFHPLEQYNFDEIAKLEQN
jgi:hypothetical protein